MGTCFGRLDAGFYTPLYICQMAPRGVGFRGISCPVFGHFSSYK